VWWYGAEKIAKICVLICSFQLLDHFVLIFSDQEAFLLKPACCVIIIIMSSMIKMLLGFHRNITPVWFLLCYSHGKCSRMVCAMWLPPLRSECRTCALGFGLHAFRTSGDRWPLCDVSFNLLLWREMCCEGLGLLWQNQWLFLDTCEKRSVVFLLLLHPAQSVLSFGGCHLGFCSVPVLINFLFTTYLLHWDFFFNMITSCDTTLSGLYAKLSWANHLLNSFLYKR